jgi:chorismate mutase-like protein
MHEVAKTKWNGGLPVEDKVREQQILGVLAAQAGQYSLDPQWVTRFFQAQIEASKEIQRADLAIWQKEGRPKFEKTLSLQTELRSCIDDINREMLVVLGKIGRKKTMPNKAYVLKQPVPVKQTDAISDGTWLTATAPLAVSDPEIHARL